MAPHVNKMSPLDGAAATSLVALRWMCDPPQTGCVRRTTIYIRGPNKQ